MYGSSTDPYGYPGTQVLRNRVGLRNAFALATFESALTSQRGEEPFPSGRLSLSHYKAIHRHIFQDVYDWAGKFRTIRISKGASTFCYPEHIPTQMRALFETLSHNSLLRGRSAEDFTIAAAQVLTTLNAIHPFRDGHGRSQLAFMAMLGHQAGHPLHLERLEPGLFLDAMIKSFCGDEQPLVAALRSLVVPF